MAFNTGQEVQKGPKQIPANPRLWNLTTMQAKTRFSKYPSPAAAHWVHAHYAQMGGRFVTSEKEVDPRNRDRVQEATDAREKAAKKKVTTPIGINITKGEHFK